MSMYAHSSPIQTDPTSLTTIESDIVKLICQGYNSGEIARRLYKSTRTIEGYRRSILEKTGTRNVAGIVIFAIETGLISVNRS